MSDFHEVTIGPCRLILADCMDVLPTLSGVDAVVTDPPYGIKHKSHGQLFVQSSPIAGDDTVELAQAVLEWSERRNCCIAAFYSPFVPLSGFRNVLVWSKGEHVGIGGDRETCWKRDFELIGIARNKPLRGNRDSSILRFNAVLPPPSGHFCEKPVLLMEHLIWKLNPVSVCDPFMGSGSAGEACVRLGVDFIGIETDERWFEYSVKRIRRAWQEKCSEIKWDEPVKLKQLDLIGEDHV